MFDNLNNLIDEYKDDIISSTSQLIQKKSVESDPVDNMPFGKGINEALETSLEIANILGLKNVNVDGYAGYAEIGESEEMVGVLTHLDVVPEGDDWTYPPYGGEIHNDKIYGRGALDNKGPTVAILYALKAIKESRIKLNKRVRLIMGTDEESGWEGLDYYKQKEKLPEIGFSPDAYFPVIHAEKGIIVFDLNKNFSGKKYNSDKIKIKTIKGGNAPNMIPDYCESKIEPGTSDITRLEEYIEKSEYDLDLVKENNDLILKSFGKSAHGSMPEEGQNAISQLMVFLNELDIAEDDIGKFIKWYNNKIGMEYYGESIGCGFKDNVSGNLIFNVGMIELVETQVKITVNIRYPVTYTEKQVLKGMKNGINDTDIKIQENQHIGPLHVPQDDELVVKLMEVYKEFTGEDLKPVAIGGGTYARALDKAVAFGALFPGSPEVAHKKDEYIKIEDLIKMTKIYANAIVKLAE
ncbi:MAG: dipeptidase PepV [Halanaerobiaceae bacterium]